MARTSSADVESSGAGEQTMGEAVGSGAPMDAKKTGLEQKFEASGKGKVRPHAKSMPIRKGDVWKTVSVTFNDKAYTTAPDLVCIDCKKVFSGGASRIKQHIIKQCTCSTDTLKELKKKIISESTEAAESSALKRKCVEVDLATAEDEVQATDEQVSGSKAHTPLPQQLTLPSLLNGVTSEIMDNKIADLVFGEGLPFSFVSSPQFIELLTFARHAPSSYKPPTQQRLAGVRV